MVGREILTEETRNGVMKELRVDTINTIRLAAIESSGGAVLLTGSFRMIIQLPKF
jgi:hypothetical protein